MGRDGFTSGRPKLGAAHHAFLVVTVVACRLLAISACPTYDDAFITYRYALNAGDGLGLVFNPGSPWEPVLGTTTPLFAWILTLFAKLGLDLVTTALALDIFFDACSAALIPRLFGRARASSTWALLAFAAFPPLVRITVGGMEAPLFSLFALLAVLAAAADKPVRAGVWSALTCLVRPEGVLLCVILLISGFSARRDARRIVLSMLVPMLVIGTIAVAILTAKYGSPIPQSVIAKAKMQPVDPDGLTFARLKSIWSQAFLPHWVLLPLLPIVLIGAWRALRNPGALRLYSVFALAIVVAYSIAHPHTWGWYYFVPLAAWTFWFALQFDRLARSASKSFGPALSSAGALFGAPIGGALAMITTLIIGLRHESRIPRDVYAPLGKWARETSAMEPDARVLASDIGIIGWNWRGVVLDSEGLVWPAALAHGSLNAILEAERPEYFVFLVERTRLLHLQKRADVFALYEPIARFNGTGETALKPTVDELDDEWGQDYIVYRRRAR
ncbi:MAG: hypothetical protein SGI72_09235 [Planctomycetota bacterium]|nr:hypothetical protein [Planctomycetota bacterium]